jgi:hypothetical protein
VACGMTPPGAAGSAAEQHEWPLNRRQSEARRARGAILLLTSTLMHMSEMVDYLGGDNAATRRRLRQVANSDGASDCEAAALARASAAGTAAIAAGLRRVNYGLSKLWNNAYHSMVMLYQLFGNTSIRGRILRALPLRTLHTCARVSKTFRRWSRAHIDQRPIVVLVGGIDASWQFASRPLVFDMVATTSAMSCLCAMAAC